uniref:peptidyl-tRNA hydrolase n=1 Tax=Plasmodiophora brassicae TaxID=37360 RepID=A8E083_PLABS|nr:hypothetical protein [Plasmodiophora brassicae]CAM98713.1 hypothetical protein [Plasmodiophora brassicae]
MASSSSSADDPVLQYILVRRDLIQDLHWPIGSVVAQGAHAAVAAIAESYNDEYTSRYLADLGQMRKVVLQVDNDRHLQEFASTLRSRDVRHHVWMERPENIATCLCTAPYPQSMIRPLFAGLRLLR